MLKEERPINVAGRRFLIVGLGITGRACAEALEGTGADVIVTDVREDVGPLSESVDFVEKHGARFVHIWEAGSLDPEIIVVSPGLSMKDERLGGIPVAGVEWISEIELAYRLSRGRILAVTGTNGKSTVVTLAGEMLGKCFKDVRVSGNIGSAFIKEAVRSQNETIHVIEISSYQLEGCYTFKPDVGIVLNVQPDHQERHPTQAEYAAAKARLLAAMDEEGYAVLYHEDELVRNMAASTQAKVAWFSDAEAVRDGAFAQAGKLLIDRDGGTIDICAAEEMKIKGSHNVKNALAASLGCFLMGASPEKIRETLMEFEGLEHRIQDAGYVNGVQCVDDSKGTNVDSVIAALETYAGREITLILCGDDKGFEYAPLYEKIKELGARVIMMGKGLKRIEEEIRTAGEIEMTTAATMKDAVDMGCEITGEGGVLLLSPSSSSFDMYRDFNERGRDFKNEVQSKKNNSEKA